MAGEWQTLTLGEAGVALIDCDHRTPTAADSGYPYVAIPQLRYGRIDLSDARRISPEHFVEWTRKARPTANDVILSRRCNPGETAFVPPGLEFALGQNLVLLRADGKRVNPRFLRWLTSGPEWWQQIRKFLNVGAVFDSLKCADVPKFELTIPPLPEQRAIAHILGTLDDKIELNRRMSETLEAMARALFKAWFVDFEPVRAKIEGRWQRGQSLPGLPAHLYDLFPGRLVDSELGEIPEEWGVMTIGDLAKAEKGLSYKGDGLVGEGGLPMINLGCFVGGGHFKIEGIKRYRGEHKQRHLVSSGDLLVANTDITQNRVIIGSPVLLPKLVGEDRFLFTHHTFAIRFKSGAEKLRKYVYFNFLRPEFREMAEGFATGTTVLALPKDGLLNFPLILPPQSVLVTFDSFVDANLNAADVRRRESETLVQLRDALLPKLISGELRVPDAERLVEGTR